jgi:hypothetical protein
MMACSLLGRNPMRLINYFTSLYLGQNRIYRKSCCYLFLGLVILNLLPKFHQNCTKGSGVFRLFSSKKYQLPIFVVAKLLAKKVSV